MHLLDDSRTVKVTVHNSLGELPPVVLLWCISRAGLHVYTDDYPFCYVVVPYMRFFIPDKEVMLCCGTLYEIFYP